MAQFRLNAYDADVFFTEFRGLSAEKETINADIRYAAEATNMETVDGKLQPFVPLIKYARYDYSHGGPFGAKQGTTNNDRFTSRKYLHNPNSFNASDREGIEYFNLRNAGDCPLDEEELDWIVPRTGRLYRTGTNTQFSNFSSVVWICCINRHVYYSYGTAWTQVSYEENSDTVYDFLTDEWSFASCTDVVPDITDPSESVTVQCIFMTNPYDGMFRIRTDNFTCEKITTPVKFNQIEFYAERLWGCSNEENSETIYYSTPYTPSDWSQNSVTPEDGGGEIIVPNFNGDDFYGLKKFGDHLLAIKENCVYRLYGSDPSTYQIQEEFGTGTKFIRSICVYEDRMYMVTKEGLAVYDGVMVRPILREFTDTFWKEVITDIEWDRNASEDIRQPGICGSVIDGKYCVAYRHSTTKSENDLLNNELLVYDITNGNVFTYSMSIDDFAQGTDLVLTHEVIYDQTSTPYTKYVNFMPRLLWLDGSWELGKTNGLATKWVSPWLDLGYKTIKKGGFDLYFLPEVQDTAVTLKIGIQTEKKEKTKSYTVSPLTATELQNDKKFKQKKLHFGGVGRRFRLIIGTESGNTAPWRIIPGIHIIAETDTD